MFSDDIITISLIHLLIIMLNNIKYNMINRSCCYKPHKLPLRIKISKLVNNYALPKCSVALTKLNAFNLKIVENTQSIPYVDKKVAESRNFSFGKEKDPMIHYLNTEPFTPNYEEIGKHFVNELTPEEVESVKKNKDFYIKDKLLKENITVFNYEPLLERLNKEEREELEQKENPSRNNKNKKITLLLPNNNSFSFKDRISHRDEEEEKKIIFKKKIEREIIKDKKHNLEKNKRIQNRVRNLNKIYQQSRIELDNINKAITKITNKKSIGFLITQNGSASKNTSAIHIKKQTPVLSVVKKEKSPKRSFKGNSQDDDYTKDKLNAIKEIYLQKKKFTLPPII